MWKSNSSIHLFRNLNLSALAIRSIILVVTTYSATSNSAQWENQCRSKSEASDKECKAAVTAAQAGDAAQSSALGGMATRAIQPNTPLFTSGIQGQLGRLATAEGTCHSAKSKCQNECKNQKEQATNKCLEFTQDPVNKAYLEPACTDKGTIPNTQASKCEAPIDGEIARLKQAQNNLKNDQQANDKTQDASNQGSPPQIPPMSPPPPGEEEPKTQAEDEKLNCDSKDGTRYSDCNNHFVNKCPAEMSSATCNDFSDRFCSLAPADQEPKPPVDKLQSKSSYVVDKTGEGMGSKYCKLANAHRFCQVSGRSECPSCQNLTVNSTFTCVFSPESCRAENSSEQLEKARANCPSDPMFLDPNLTADADATPAISVDATNDTLGSNDTAPKDRLQASTPGSSGSGTNAVLPSGSNGSTTAIGQSAVSEGKSSGDSLSMQTAGGGAGGGSYNYTPEVSDESDATRSAASAANADVTVAGSAQAEVASQQSDSIFSISSQTYLALCHKKQLKCSISN